MNRVIKEMEELGIPSFKKFKLKGDSEIYFLGVTGILYMVTENEPLGMICKEGEQDILDILDEAEII